MRSGSATAYWVSSRKTRITPGAAPGPWMQCAIGKDGRTDFAEGPNRRFSVATCSPRKPDGALLELPAAAAAAIGRPPTTPGAASSAAGMPKHVADGRE